MLIAPTKTCLQNYWLISFLLAMNKITERIILGILLTVQYEFRHKKSGEQQALPLTEFATSNLNRNTGLRLSLARRTNPQDEPTGISAQHHPDSWLNPSIPTSSSSNQTRIFWILRPRTRGHAERSAVIIALQHLHGASKAKFHPALFL